MVVRSATGAPPLPGRASAFAAIAREALVPGLATVSLFLFLPAFVAFAIVNQAAMRILAAAASRSLFEAAPAPVAKPGPAFAVPRAPPPGNTRSRHRLRSQNPEEHWASRAHLSKAPKTGIGGPARKRASAAERKSERMGKERFLDAAAAKERLGTARDERFGSLPAGCKTTGIFPKNRKSGR